MRVPSSIKNNLLKLFRIGHMVLVIFAIILLATSIGTAQEYSPIDSLRAPMGKRLGFSSEIGSSAELDSLRALAPERTAAALELLINELTTTLSIDTTLDNLELEKLSTNVDELGYTHSCFGLLKNGIPVIGAQWIAHISPDGIHTFFTGDTDASRFVLPMNTNATITTDSVCGVVKSKLAEVKNLRIREPKLVLLPDIETQLRPSVKGKTDLNAADVHYVVAGYTLVYKILAVGTSAEGGIIEHVFFIDANNAQIIMDRDILKKRNCPSPLPEPNGHSQYSGTVHIPTKGSDTDGYELIDTERGTGHKYFTLWTGGNAVFDLNGFETSYYPIDGNPIGTTYQSSSNLWGDGRNYLQSDLLVDHSMMSLHGQTAAVDVSFASMVTWDLFSEILHREGLDGDGSAILTFVHGAGIVSPVWSSYQKAALFPDLVSGNQTTSPESVGHELAHGFFIDAVERGWSGWSSGGEYNGIEEANSDIFAVLVELLSTTYPSGDHTVFPEIEVDWVLFEEEGDPTTIRNMDWPSQGGTRPAFDEWFLGIDGDPHPHSVSGPINRMFYFLVEGAQPELMGTEHSSRRMPGGFEGIGVNIAARIWYHTIAYYTLPGHNFFDLKNSCLAATSVLHGVDSPEYRAVRNAFLAINVGFDLDTDGPEIYINVEKTATNLLVNVNAEDLNGISNLEFNMGSTDGEVGEGEVTDRSFVKIEVPIVIAKDRTWSLIVNAEDTLGNRSKKHRLIDLTPPELVDIKHDGSRWNKEYTVTATDDLAIRRFRMYVDGTLYDEEAPPLRFYFDPVPVTEVVSFYLNLGPLSTGSHTIRFVVIDGNGNEDKSSTISERVDNTAPLVTVDAYWRMYDELLYLSAMIEDFSASVTTSSFRIDGTEVYTAVGPTPSYSYHTDDLTEGAHTFQVVATDSWNNVGEGSTIFEVERPDSSTPPSAEIFYETEVNDITPERINRSVDQIRGEFNGTLNPAYHRITDSDMFVVTLLPGQWIDLTCSFSCTDAMLSLVEDLGGYDENWIANSLIDGEFTVSWPGSDETGTTFTIMMGMWSSCSTTYEIDVNIHY